VFDVLRGRGLALFLLDNVDRPVLLAQDQMTLLADQQWARVLYTTRLAPDDFTKAGAIIRPLDLDRLPENQAVDLIRRYQPAQAFASPEHEAATREIVRELSGLTLAVETAAVYLGQCDPRVAEPQYAVDVRDYLNKLREDLKTGCSEGVMSQLREVTATLRPTLARLDAPAQTVLQIASLLAPDGVALPWVRAIAGQSHPELVADTATGESDPWTQLILGLIGMRLFQPTGEPRIVAIHRILQRVLESQLPDGWEPLQERLEKHIKTRLTLLEDSKNWSGQLWEIEPLRQIVLQWIQEIIEEGIHLGCRVGMLLANLTRLAEAGEITTSTLSVLRTNTQSKRDDLLTAIDCCASIELSRGYTTKARLLADEGLQIAQANGPSFSLVRALLTSASIEMNEYKYELARILFEKALECEMQSPDSNIDDLSAIHMHLMSVLLATGEKEKARQHLYEALILDDQQPNLLPEDRVVGLINAAALECSCGDPQSARKHAAAALDLIETKMLNNPIRQAKGYQDVAGCFFVMQDYAESRRLLKSAIQTTEKNFGSTNAGWLVDAYANLALVESKMDLSKEALMTLKQAVKLAEKTFEPSNPSLWETYKNAMHIAGAAGDLDAMMKYSNLMGKVMRTQAAMNKPKSFLKNLDELF
jgi:tetratricopeptide (TPR) repeat protein